MKCCSSNTTFITPLLNLLLQQYPHAASCHNATHRLPLNLALNNGKSWNTGIPKILHACPRVLYGTQDVGTNMFPFMLAAVDHCSSYNPPPPPLLPTSSSPKQRLRILWEWSSQGQDYGDAEEARAKRNASSSIGGMWRFLQPAAKERAIQEARKELNTVFMLLRSMPDAVACGIRGG